MENGLINWSEKELAKVKPLSSSPPHTEAAINKALGRNSASADFVQKLKNSVNIVEVIGENVVLRKSGANYFGLCPFHSERSPSFSVTESKQLFHCYGCKQGGDVVAFVMEISGLSFREAIEELAERARVGLPPEWAGKSSENDDPTQRQEQREKLTLAYKLNRFAAAYYHQNLSEDFKAIEYFKKRGVNQQTQQAFYLGSAPASWDNLAKHLVDKKAPIDLAQTLGLVRASQKAQNLPGSMGYFDLFRNRTLFPILNQRGKVAGFGGRVFSDQDTPKYLNSPDSSVFHKGKLAYGLYQAQKHIRELDEVILVEGYFDVLTLAAAGFQNVVATCGTALTVDHLHLFKRLASQVTVVFDGDSAGISATLRAMELGLDQGWVLRGVRLPPDLDPDEILLDLETGEVRSDGKERMTELLKGALPILDSQIAEVLQGAKDGPEAQSQALKKIGGWLSRLNDPVGRTLRLERVQKQLGISRALLQEVQGGVKVEIKKNPIELFLPKKKSLMKPVDQLLISGLATGGEFREIFFDAQGQLPPGFQVLELLEDNSAKEWIQDHFPIPGQPAFEKLDGITKAIITASLVSESALIKIDEFRTAVLKGVAKKWARFSQQIKMQIVQAEANNDAGLQEKLMKDYLDVQRKMKDFNSFYDEE